MKRISDEKLSIQLVLEGWAHDEFNRILLCAPTESGSPERAAFIQHEMERIEATCNERTGGLADPWDPETGLHAGTDAPRSDLEAETLYRTIDEIQKHDRYWWDRQQIVWKLLLEEYRAEGRRSKTKTIKPTVIEQAMLDEEMIEQNPAWNADPSQPRWIPMKNWYVHSVWIEFCSQVPLSVWAKKFARRKGGIALTPDTLSGHSADHRLPESLRDRLRKRIEQVSV